MTTTKGTSTVPDDEERGFERSLDPAVEASFEELYRTMLPTVYRFTTARLGPVEGEDVAGEVFHAAVVAYTDGRRDAVTPAWLMAVARNKVIDRWRKAERRNAITFLNRKRPTELMSFPEDWAESPQRGAVLATLDRLTPRHRNLLVAHYVDGMAVPELADLIGSSVAAIESALARARRSFRAHYDPEVSR